MQSLHVILMERVCRRTPIQSMNAKWEFFADPEEEGSDE
jgi:hypothetical protein